jgi:thiamine biosynthesis lipoprotein
VTRVIVVLAAAALSGCATPAAAPTGTATLVEREVFLMGTRARLAAWDVDRASGLRTVNEALEILEQTEAELSTWRDDSVVSRLNRQPIGRPFTLPGAACRAFGALDATTLATGGTFDPAIGRLAAAWDIHGQGRVPDARRLAAARATSGWPLVHFDAVSCSVTRRADVTIDVGAFGKGEALDRVRGSVTGTWLIDLGGQIAVSGVPPGEPGWRVSIAHPRLRQQPLLDVVLRAGSLSTSGSSERDLVVDGRRIAHHLDPRTGQPAAFDGAVSVWHRDGVHADMLSTALYVMGPDAGLRWATEWQLAVAYLRPCENGEVEVAATPSFVALGRRERARSWSEVTC